MSCVVFKIISSLAFISKSFASITPVSTLIFPDALTNSVEATPVPTESATSFVP